MSIAISELNQDCLLWYNHLYRHFKINEKKIGPTEVISGPCYLWHTYLYFRINTTEFTEFTEKHKLDGLQKRDRDLRGPYYTDAKKQRPCL